MKILKGSLTLLSFNYSVHAYSHYMSKHAHTKNPLRWIVLSLSGHSFKHKDVLPAQTQNRRDNPWL